MLLEVLGIRIITRKRAKAIDDFFGSIKDAL